MASSNVLVYGKGLTVPMLSNSLTSGSCRRFMGRFSRMSLTKGTRGSSAALTHMLQLTDSRTANAPFRLFFGDRNSACGKNFASVSTILLQCRNDDMYKNTNSISDLDTGVCQQNVSQIILASHIVSTVDLQQAFWIM